MRKVFIASVGTLLVLFLATSGYPAQGAVAVQGSGDVTLHFGIQQENDYEVRENYDLDNGLTDGCAQLDCSGARSSVDGFFTQETRLIIQGSQGDIWKMRVTLEAPEGNLQGRVEQPAINLERAWADIKLYDTPVHIRVGAPLWDQLDPFRLVWSDDEPGIKVYATHGNISWAVWWLKEDEVSSRKGAEGGRDGDQDYYLARVDLDFGSFQVSPTFGLIRNKTTTTDPRFARGIIKKAFCDGDPCDSDDERSGQHLDFSFESGGIDSNLDGFAVGVSADETVFYPGIVAKGTFGPVSFVGEFFAAVGEIGDDSTFDSQREQDVTAYMLAFDVGVKLGAWTPHAGMIYMSGDDNPHDNDAEAWAPIASDNENLLGTRGIIMDDAISVLSLADDALTEDTVSPAARKYALSPGMIAVFAGLKGRPTKKIKTDLWLTYFQWDKERQWEFIDGMVSRSNCLPSETRSTEGICSNGIFTNGVASEAPALGKKIDEDDESGLVTTIDDEVGWELNGQVTYAYNKHVTLTIAAAVFWPGDGAEILAQCINASTGIERRDDDHDPIQAGNTILNETVRGTKGCDPRHTHEDSTGDLTESGTKFRSDVTNERADDEAFNIEVELMVQF
ncbi:MAG: hypothetical protein IH975_10040 [Nitrospinae bacterium]|nr:hypothetical protein [Nitrospinota bacterium]